MSQNIDSHQALLDFHELVGFEPWFAALRLAPVGNTVGRDPTPFLSGRHLRQQRPRTTNADESHLGLVLYVKWHSDDSTRFVSKGFQGLNVVVVKT